MKKRGPWSIALVLALCLSSAGLLAACSSDDSSSPTTTTPKRVTPTTGAVAPLSILVANDDGYSAEGIDTLVRALDELPSVTVTVVAPLDDQSGQGGKTTKGELAVTDVKTKSGHAAKAVAGHSADAVDVAFDELGVKPDVVITGIDKGQNVGPLVDV